MSENLGTEAEMDFYNDSAINESSKVVNVEIISQALDWGPKRDPLYIVLPITALYVVIFITGVLGNISTCIVISKNKSMHTATNYYLFSLAISDLLLLVSGLPPEIYSIWSKYPYIFGEAFCVLQGFAAETSANATVLTITAFTVERYVAICHPFLSHTMSKLSRAIKFIIAIWIVAMCLAIPQAMAFGIVYEDGRILDDEHYVCSVKRIVIPHAFEISTFLFFVAPMSLITILYILIGLQLHRSTVGPSRGNSVRLKHRVYKPHVAYTPSSTQAVLYVNGEVPETTQLNRQEDEGRKNFARNAQAAKHVVKMLVAVVVAFFICWAPFHAQRLLAIYGQPNSHNMVTAFRILTYISGVLYYLSTSVNPFLYHIMSHKFREAFKETFKEMCRRNVPHKGVRCYSTLSARSSQINSNSNTDSCSRQSSLRYLEAEMARLHDSKRPLVVSFRRKKSQYPKRTKHVTILDAELQEALDNLKVAPQGRELFEKVRPYKNPRYSSSACNKSKLEDFAFIEVHHLEPKHICPIRTRRSRSHHHHSDMARSHKTDSYNDESSEKDATMESLNQVLTKSCTMPHMVMQADNKNAKIMDKYLTPNNEDDYVGNERSTSCSQLDSLRQQVTSSGVTAESNLIIKVT